MLPLALPTYLAAFVAVDLLDFFGPVQTAYRAVIGAKTMADYRFFDIRSLGWRGGCPGAVLAPYVYLGCRIVFLQSGRKHHRGGAAAGRARGQAVLPGWSARGRARHGGRHRPGLARNTE